MIKTHQTKNLCSLKDIIKRMKTQATDFQMRYIINKLYLK